MSERGYLSIGEVLSMLHAEFPDVTISKIRFLESQGLIDPERTPSGYRKFYEPDVVRLRWILRQQKEHFWPLRIIRSKLDEAARADGSPEDLSADAAPARPSAVGGRPEPPPNGRPAAKPASVAPPPATSGPPPPSTAVGRRVAAPFPASLATAARAEAGRRTEAEAVQRTAADADRHPGPRAGKAGTPDRPATTATTAAAAEPPHGGRGGSAGQGSEGVEAVQASEATGAAVGTDREGSDARRRTEGDVGHGVESDAPRRAEAGEGRGVGFEAGRRAQAEAGRRAAVEAGRKAQAQTSARPQAPETRMTEPLVDNGAPRRTPASYLTAPVEARSAAPEEPVELTAEELAEAVGLTVAELADLQKYGLVVSRHSSGGQYFDEVALVVAQLAARFARFGVEPRHLRIWRTAAEREAGFFEQVVTPLLKQRNPQARRQAAENLRELATLGNRLHAALVRAELKGRDR